MLTVQWGSVIAGKLAFLTRQSPKKGQAHEVKTKLTCYFQKRGTRKTKFNKKKKKHRDIIEII